MKIAIISDMHCCHSSSKNACDSFLLSDQLRTPPEKHPVQSLLDSINKDHISADILLSLGDMTNRTDKQGLISAWGFINEIANALNVRSIIPTLGNHDVNWSRAQHIPEEDSHSHNYIVKNLSSKFPYDIREQSNDFFANGVVHIEFDKWNFIVLDSTYSMENKEDGECGKLTDSQISLARDKVSRIDKEEPKIFVLHHHPIIHDDPSAGRSDIIIGNEKFMELVEFARPSLVIHGHKHQARISYSKDTIPIIASGSFSAIPKGCLAGYVSNMFHLIDIQLIDGSICGIINSWIYAQIKGWFQSLTTEISFPCRSGFGCTENLASLRDKIINQFPDDEFLKWSQVISAFDQLKYLSPQQLKKLESLFNQKGWSIEPPSPNYPKIICKKTL